MAQTKAKKVAWGIYKKLGPFPGDYWDGDFRSLKAAQKKFKTSYAVADSQNQDFRIVRITHEAEEMPNGLQQRDPRSQR